MNSKSAYSLKKYFFFCHLSTLSVLRIWSGVSWTLKFNDNRTVTSLEPMLCKEEREEKYTRCRVLCFKQIKLWTLWLSLCFLWHQSDSVSYIYIPLVPCINTKGWMFTAVIQRTHCGFKAIFVASLNSLRSVDV